MIFVTDKGSNQNHVAGFRLKWIRVCRLWVFSLLWLCSQKATLVAVTYEVGPGHLFSTPLFVPWQKLIAGDVVRIHWREKPYRAGWVICRQGTARAPIVVQGVSGPEGQQPVIEGNRAFTAPHLDYSGRNRAVIRIGSANNSDVDAPAHIIVENLHLRGANKTNHFMTREGKLEKYLPYAAGIHIERGHHITIHNCTLEDNGNGLMTSHRSQDVIIDGSHFYNNGYPNDIFSHNLYTATLNLTIRNNRFCPLKEDAKGNNIKDRSAGLHIHHNTIYGGNKLLDLVDAEDSEVLRTHPAYMNTLVEHNLLIQPDKNSSGRILHFGGDSGDVLNYRKELTFQNNTVLTQHKGTTILFRAETNNQHILAQDNIFHQLNPGDLDTQWQLVQNRCFLELKNNRITGRWLQQDPKTHFRSQPRITGQNTFLRRPPITKWNQPMSPCEHHSH